MRKNHLYKLLTKALPLLALTLSLAFVACTQAVSSKTQAVDKQEALTIKY